MTPKYTVEQGPRGKKQLGRGLCPHCNHRVSFVAPTGGAPSWSYLERGQAEDDNHPSTTVEHTFIIGLCPDPECGKATILYEVGESVDQVWDSWELIKHQVAYPAESGRMLLDEEIPEPLRALYAEAGRIEGTSPNGAAFLGRRLLEFLLKDQLQIKSKHTPRLSKLIDRYLETAAVPSQLAELMHDIRNFGNIAGHPVATEAGALLDVEPKEATYVLDVVGQLLDYIYVRPQTQKRMRARYLAKNEGRIPDPDHQGHGISVVAAKPNPDLFTSPAEDLPF